MKRIAFKEYGVRSTAEIKLLLTQLKIKLDLRLTSAWDAIVFELRSQILELPRVGKKVIWINAPAYFHTWWKDIKIQKLIGDRAMIDMWEKPVPIDELELAA